MIIPVDKIYLLHLCECPERLVNFNKEYDNMDIENDFEIWWACKHPHTESIARYLKSENKFTWNGKGNGNAFNCTREHYNIIKQAYHRGFSSIAIFEDDWEWKDDKNKIQEFFSHQLPDDWDMITFGYYTDPTWSNNDDIHSIEKIELNKINRNYMDCWGTPFYILNRTGMKFYIDYMDKEYSVADMPLAVAWNYINSYRTNISLYKYNSGIPTQIQ